jgi:N-acetylglutamate synthase-like GNAT family acetyltransferase
VRHAETRQRGVLIEPGRDTMAWRIRAARVEDADGISEIILSALRRTNAKDYTPEIIARVERGFAPSMILDLLKARTVFVALSNHRIIGTASLEGKTVRSVFVAPELQGQGVGRRLMARVERTARENGVTTLAVPSSVTAEQFYAKLGFKSVRDSWYGDERTIIMEKALSP